MSTTIFHARPAFRGKPDAALFAINHWGPWLVPRMIVLHAAVARDAVASEVALQVLHVLMLRDGAAGDFTAADRAPTCNRRHLTLRKRASS